MTRLRYRAFISYSHQDEAWASWLHRALETYRVPRHLSGTETELGEVPRRVRPVFRDRDDMSSATDLADTVKQALSDSENLVVVCSPAAASSRWVNNEIREFAALGRSDRVFCIIVDGEPSDDDSVSNCFPTALAEIGLREPLAADVRKWADGKHVALLKLIAGLLGIRLDQLRQRDLQRRRKRQLMVGLGLFAALTLSVMTVVSQVSERHEREKAEQLATFIVDLGERLKSDADLETLALISAEASRHLQTLDPDKLSPETGKKVALAMRQVGQVSQHQGKPDEAFEAYERSHELLSRLNRKYSELPDLLFELGNAEYYIGNLHLELEQYDLALAYMEKYHEITQELRAMDPDNPDWILEMAYSNNNLAAVRVSSGAGINEEVLGYLSEAIRMMEMAVALKPDDETVVSFYANTLAWAADTQLQACNLHENLELRERVLKLAEFATEKAPGNNDLRQNYAYALTGFAGAQVAMGQLEHATENLKQAISILQQLFVADPGKVTYGEARLYRQVMLLRLLWETGRFDSAEPLLSQIKTGFESFGDMTDQSGVRQREYVDFLLVYADIESGSGISESAKRHLQEVIEIQLARQDQQERDIYDTHRLVVARYQLWQLNGRDNFDQSHLMPEFHHVDTGEYRSCDEVDSAARMYVMEGNRVSALSQVDYLRSRGYADPGFIRFCEQNDLCGG